MEDLGRGAYSVCPANLTPIVALYHNCSCLLASKGSHACFYSRKSTLLRFRPRLRIEVSVDHATATIGREAKEEAFSCMISCLVILRA